jgi:hypothetical protein
MVLSETRAATARYGRAAALVCVVDDDTAMLRALRLLHRDLRLQRRDVRLGGAVPRVPALANGRLLVVDITSAG